MIKYWKIKNRNTIDIVLISKGSLYKGKIKAVNIINFENQVKNEDIPKEFFEIPFSYIKKIEYQKNKKYIKIYFGDSSEEELYSDEESLKDDIFNNLKEVIPNTIYYKKRPSLIQYAKPQLFALFFSSIIFVWSLYYAIQLENGAQYELKGRAGLSSIVFSIGLMGKVKVIVSYLLIGSLISYSIIRKNKSRTEIEYLNKSYS